MEKQMIECKQAKKHIMDALKKVFPGVKFSYRSEFDSVSVYWTDGPLAGDVEKVLNRFQSYLWIRARSDRHEAIGYEWEGVTYIGPRYLSATRKLSPERKTALIDYMAKGEMSFYDAYVYERAEAEREMIRAGMLDGVEPEDVPDSMRDERPMKDIREQEKAEAAAKAAKVPTSDMNPDSDAKAKIYHFPTQHAERQPLTPEQKLKLKALNVLYQWEEKEILACGLSVDELFSLAAREMN